MATRREPHPRLGRCCVVDSRGCAAYMAWEYRVSRGLFDDELGPLARDYVGSAASWVALDNRSPTRLDVVGRHILTPGITETASRSSQRRDGRGGAELRAAPGDPDGWTWGRLHTATFREPTIGSSGIGPLEWYFNAGPVPVDGADGAIDNLYYRLGRGYPDPDDPTVVPVGIDELFAVTTLPSYRLVSTCPISTARGSSSRPDSPACRSTGTTPTRSSRGGPVRRSRCRSRRAAIDAATVATLTLRPAPA